MNDDDVSRRRNLSQKLSEKMDSGDWATSYEMAERQEKERAARIRKAIEEFQNRGKGS
ncbi:hypothetical protein GCM10011390_44330 [Aureimonas endophytica]|uniref:Uncharacterized protein n=1 Tax=Aureimonas endophytica TaxID=2027858 RepID=A0A916ZZH2_9HYPH|nr:hypothetical protein GCM10011390_44330 [Aureimonas endophytica]